LIDIARLREEADELTEEPFTPARAKRRFALLMRALRHRDPYLVWSLADAYQHGDGCAPSLKRAIKYLEIAVELGQADAMTSLGKICVEELDPPNWPRAIALYKAAAARGQEHAMYNLALCYRNGEGVRRNPASALRYLKRAADAGHPQAMAQLALAILQGAAKGDGRDPLQLIRMAADGGDEPAAFADDIIGLLGCKAPVRGRTARRAPPNVSRETRKRVTL
jgi:TPR repeat protein